jgi:hypothetical protein
VLFVHRVTDAIKPVIAEQGGGASTPPKKNRESGCYEAMREPQPRLSRVTLPSSAVEQSSNLTATRISDANTA